MDRRERRGLGGSAGTRATACQAALPSRRAACARESVPRAPRPPSGCVRQRARARGA